MIEGCLSSSYDVINNKAVENRFLYPFTKISKKITPLIAEYLKFAPLLSNHQAAPRFTHYDAFAPQAITFVSKIKHYYSKYLDQIKYYIIHNNQDPNVPLASAQKIINQLNTQCTANITKYGVAHIISHNKRIQNDIYNFIQQSIAHNPSSEINSKEANHDAYLEALSKDEQWFIKQSKPMRWIIRRIRDSIISGIIISGCYILIKVPLFLYTKIRKLII